MGEDSKEPSFVEVLHGFLFIDHRVESEQCEFRRHRRGVLHLHGEGTEGELLPPPAPRSRRRLDAGRHVPDVIKRNDVFLTIDERRFPVVQRRVVHVLGVMDLVLEAVDPSHHAFDAGTMVRGLNPGLHNLGQIDPVDVSVDVSRCGDFRGAVGSWLC